MPAPKARQITTFCRHCDREVSNGCDQRLGYRRTQGESAKQSRFDLLDSGATLGRVKDSPFADTIIRNPRCDVRIDDDKGYHIKRQYGQETLISHACKTHARWAGSRTTHDRKDDHAADTHVYAMTGYEKFFAPKEPKQP